VKIHQTIERDRKKEQKKVLKTYYKKFVFDGRKNNFLKPFI